MIRKKKWILGLAALGIIVCLSGYRAGTEKKPEESAPGSVALESNTYEIAFMEEKPEEEGEESLPNIWEGAAEYAEENSITHSFYKPERNSDSACEEVMETAVKRGAKIIVAQGASFARIICRLQNEYPKVQFLLLDAKPQDENGNDKMQTNVHCILFTEEEAGYLAGYAAVSEGYTRLGFWGGDDSVQTQRYGCGFIRGADDAARNGKIKLKYWNTGTDCSHAEIEKKMGDWYEEGTQLIFTGENSDIQTVIKTAEKMDGKLIASVGNQSKDSEAILAYVEKNRTDAVLQALEKLYDNGGVWVYEQAGKSICLGLRENAVGLVEEKTKWRFENFSKRDYRKICEAVENEELQITTGISSLPKSKNIQIDLQE